VTGASGAGLGEGAGLLNGGQPGTTAYGR